MNLQESTKGTVCLKDKKVIVIDGVENVLSFDESYATMSTALGEISVEGSDLKIESLSKEKGEITVKGNIIAFYYKEKPAKKRRG